MKVRMLLALSVLALAGAAAQAQTSHFKFWKIEPMPFRRRVSLQGQFDKERWITTTTSIAFIANPVMKNEEPVPNKVTRLIAYRLAAHGPRRMVILSNQVAREERILIGDPALLLVPARMAQTPPKAVALARPLDHFLCYIVLDASAINRDYSLEDEFDAAERAKEKVSDLLPAFFCVPVSKNGERIPDRKTHLMLYAFKPRTALKPLFTFGAVDQFGPKRLTAIESVLLGVPSEKLSWKLQP